MLDRIGNVRNHLCPTLIVFRERFVNAPLPPDRSHIFPLRLPNKTTNSHLSLSLRLKRVEKSFGRVHCDRCRESIIPCLNVPDSFGVFEQSLPLFPSVCLAQAMTVLLSESIDVKSGVNHVLSSGGQGDGEQDRVLANSGIVKKAVEQECGIMCLVAHIGFGQTGRELV